MNRAIATATMLTMAGGPLGCGYLLYPERRGTQSGTIDSGTMVMDLLWLLPGIIPGVVALIVDFSSGAIYVRGRTALRISPDGRIAVRLPSSEKATQLEFRVVTSSHRVLARKVASIGPSSLAARSVDIEMGETIRQSVAQGVVGKSEELFLEVQVDGGESHRFPTPMEMAQGG
jgi:hypothetical protein